MTLDTSPISTLPTEILLQIFLQVPPLDFFSAVAVTCRRWGHITRTAFDRDGKLPVEVSLAVSDLMHEALPIKAVVGKLFKVFKPVGCKLGGDRAITAPSAIAVTVTKISLFVPAHLLHTTPIFTELASVVTDAAIRSAPRIRPIRRGLIPVPICVDVMSVDNPSLSRGRGGTPLLDFAAQFSQRFALNSISISEEVLLAWIRGNVLPAPSVQEVSIQRIPNAVSRSSTVFADPFTVFPNMHTLRIESYTERDNTAFLQAVTTKSSYSNSYNLESFFTLGFNFTVPLSFFPIYLSNLLSAFPNLTELGHLMLFDDSNHLWPDLAYIAPADLTRGLEANALTKSWSQPSVTTLHVRVAPRMHRNDMSNTALLVAFARAVKVYFPNVQEIVFDLAFPSPVKPLSPTDAPIAHSSWGAFVQDVPGQRLRFTGDVVELVLREGWLSGARSVSESKGAEWVGWFLGGLVERAKSCGKQIVVGSRY
ncbi:hypothetical protein HDU93_004384 [Gonapodya sp. JEL0774]|nr:hypothetical protein HDU93_004384 [Gonapodya sp. JEL0774]